MPLYRIERQLPAVSDEELDAAAFRALTCLAHFQNLRWVRSYYDRQASHFTCIYEAESEAQIRQHAERARIPCDVVVEVTEYLPEHYR